MTDRLPDPTVIDFLATPSLTHYYKFPVQMRTKPTIEFFSPESGYTGDVYNRTAEKDLRLTGGSGKDGSFRTAPAGADTIRADFLTQDGMMMFLNSGVIQWDDVSIHYVADADFNTDLT